MNFFPGTLAAQDGGRARVEALGAVLGLEAAPAAEVRPAGGSERSAALPRARAPEGRQVVVGIRPEDLEMTSARDADVQARVDVVEPLGRESLLHLVAIGEPGDPVVELQALTGPGTAIEPGSKVGLRLRRERIHLFDPATEERI